MAWLRVQLSEAEQAIVKEELECHPNTHVRQRMLVLWLLHCEVTRQKAARIAGVGRATVRRWVAAYRDGGLDALRRWEVHEPESELAAYREQIVELFTLQPARTVAEAAERIYQKTGVRRKPTQVRKFLERPGPEVAARAGDPHPPQKSLAEHVQEQSRFLDQELKPCLDAAQAGQGHVLFVDAAYFVFGTFLCCLWSFARIFVRAASERQRFNVLGAWNAVTRELTYVANTTVVNTETMCELLRKIAAQQLVGPIALVLDNARYQRNAAVQALAEELKISLLFLPSYSPNLNLIERPWKFLKRRALYGRYHPTFADFRAAIEEQLAQLSTEHRTSLASLMTHNFQQFSDVSLLAA